MAESRASGGVPLPTVWQWLVVGAALGAAWLIWIEFRGSPADSGVSRRGDAEEDPGAATFENLRMLEGIARTGPDGVPDLVAALANPNFRLRRNALFALRQMGPEAGEALAPIRERLADQDAQVRSFAIDAYWYIRRDPDDVAAVIVPMLGDPDADVREAAGKVLDTIGPPAIGPVVELMRSGVPAARVPTLNALRRIGWDRSQMQIDDVVRDLVCDADAHLEALRTLATWGHPTPSEIRELLQHNETADSKGKSPSMGPGPRETALSAIIRLGTDAAENLNDVLDVLAENLRGGQQWSSALAALRAMQSAARPAAPWLLQFVNENNDYRRIDVGWTLLAIGVDSQEIVRITVPLLLDNDPDICFHAGRLCASASPDEARRQVSRLIPQLALEKIAEGRPALEAIWGLAPEAQEAIPTLSRLLECEQPHVVRIAAKTLGDIGPQAAPAVPALLAQLARGLDAHDYWARSAFCEAIGKMGPAARSAIPALLMELNDAPLSRPSVDNLNRVGQRPVGEALSALARIGVSDPAVLAAMRRHLANADESAPMTALRALARLTPDSPEVLTCYLKWLRDNRGLNNHRVDVILAIGRLTGDRHEAVTPLTALLADGAPEIRKTTAWSLGKIGPEASSALPFLKEVLKDWKDSLYSIDNWRYPVQPSLADDPRTRLEMGRWRDLDDPWISGMKDLRFQQKSVQQVVREAIAEIEAGSNESGPPPMRK